MEASREGGAEAPHRPGGTSSPPRGLCRPLQARLQCSSGPKLRVLSGGGWATSGSETSAIKSSQREAGLCLPSPCTVSARGGRPGCAVSRSQHGSSGH